MEPFTDYDMDRAATVLNAALGRALETRLQVREIALLGVLSKLDQRLSRQNPTDRVRVTPEQIQTISFFIRANRHSMRQDGFKPLDTARLRNIEQRFGDEASIDNPTAIMSLLRIIEHPTLKLNPAEKLVVCEALALIKDEADRLRSKRETKSTTKH
jgi:hypothetical protein